MLKLSWCILAYGVLLFVSDLADRAGGLGLQFSSATMIPVWSAGLIAIAAAIASNQRRRSLRITGTYIGLFIALVMGALFTYHSIQLARSGSNMGPILANGVLALAGMTSVIFAITQLPREGIATRGYAVPFAHHPPQKAESSAPARRSEAG